MQQTLMTPLDVIEYSGVKKLGFGFCTFRQLFQIEYEQARNCIGFDLYQSMLDALADYSEVVEYQAGSYTQDSVVGFKGLVYKAKVNTSNMPTVATDWELAPKFEGDCAEIYDYLFCNFLAPYLAHKVLSRRLPYLRNVISDTGVLEYAGDAYDTTNEEQFKSLQHAINRDAAQSWANLQHYMLQDTQKALSETCLKGWLDYETNSCENEAGCTPKSNRTGIYRFG